MWGIGTVMRAELSTGCGFTQGWVVKNEREIGEKDGELHFQTKYVLIVLLYCVITVKLNVNIYLFTYNNALNLYKLRRYNKEALKNEERKRKMCNDHRSPCPQRSRKQTSVI